MRGSTIPFSCASSSLNIKRHISWWHAYWWYFVIFIHHLVVTSGKFDLNKSSVTQKLVGKFWFLVRRKNYLVSDGIGELDHWNFVPLSSNNSSRISKGSAWGMERVPNQRRTWLWLEYSLQKTSMKILEKVKHHCMLIKYLKNKYK